ncbi:MAG: FAD:protein FMN transferase [Chloroflexi bacterium]|nr:FAD:protein FMN transferase [Chloroflexota bacterium]
MIERSFQAMGGTVELTLLDDTDAAAEHIEDLFQEYEHRLSRFLPWGELAALHRAAGSPFAASRILFDAVSQAVEWAGVSGGVFDPTVIDALEANGYDRTFERVAGGTAVRERRRPFAAARWANIALDPVARTITLPPGVRIDVGGIGKGFTVDRAIQALGADANAIVNASGDLYAAGNGPAGDGWYVGIADPHDPVRDLAILRVRDRGVATSGSTGRNWALGDHRYHHLIDARTGESAASDLLTATVVADTATHADLLAKTAFLLGSEEGLPFVERFGAACLAVTGDGTVLMTGRLKDYLA